MGLIDERNLKGGYASAYIKGGYGVIDYYKFYRQRGGTLTRGAFSRIQRAVNKIVMSEIIEEADSFRLPYQMGKISIRKRKNSAFTTPEGIKTNSAVDWPKTMALWESDTRAHQTRVKVKYSNMHTGRYMFKIKTFERKFKNKDFYQMSYKRSVKRAFAKRIKTYNKPKIDAYIKKRI